MPHMTVLDNTAFGMELAGVAASERQEKALDALRRWGWKIMPMRIRMSFPAACVSV